MGPPGPPGLNGRDGQAGRDGQHGRDGLPGVQGPMGSKGEVGQPGLPGAHGPMGSKGEVGQPGLPGAHGPMGPKGEVGPQGQPGNKGDIGPHGNPGMKGQAGENNVFGTQVFSAFKRTTSGSSRGGGFSGIINYDKVVIGSDLINKDTGVFKVKVAGTYMLFFSAEYFTTSYADVGVYVNGVKELQFYDEQESDGNNHYSHVGSTWTLKLSLGDEVYLKTDAGKIFVNRAHRAYFNGFLIKPEQPIQNCFQIQF